MTAEWNLRCPDCEALKRGFTYRELINGRCKQHAIMAIVNGSFVEVQWCSDRTGTGFRMRGLLAHWPYDHTFQIIKFAKRPDESSRIFSAQIQEWQLRAIRPVSDVEQMQDLPVGTAVNVQHFGRVYGGRVIQCGWTRVLVRFRARNGNIYDRWKHCFQVQQILFPTTQPSAIQSSKGV